MTHEIRITMIRRVRVEIPDDATPEEADRIAEAALDRVESDIGSNIDDWDWSGPLPMAIRRPRASDYAEIDGHRWVTDRSNLLRADVVDLVVAERSYVIDWHRWSDEDVESARAVLAGAIPGPEGEHRLPPRLAPLLRHADEREWLQGMLYLRRGGELIAVLCGSRRQHDDDVDECGNPCGPAAVTP